MCEIVRLSFFSRHCRWARNRNGAGRFLIFFARLFVANNGGFLECTMEFGNINVLISEQI